MSGPLHVVTLDHAKKILEKHWQPPSRVEELPLSGAGGRILAVGVRSTIDLPPFDRATVDGYAVHATDTYRTNEGAPVELELVGSVRAGEVFRPKLGVHQCVEIATGAPMPKGADAVVMVEHSVVKMGVVDIHRAVAPGENVAKRGSELKRGTKILRAGLQLTPPTIGALAAVGLTRVKVYKPPKVAVISSGAEIAKPGAKLGAGQVYDVNGPTICDAVKACGGTPLYLGIAPDEASGIKALVRRGLASCDIVVVSGGSSAGAGDIAPAAVNSLGKPGVLAHGLALKPGKPTFIAVVRGKPVFGLPGYPVSALMVFDQLVAPYIRRVAGLPPLERKTTRTKLAQKLLSARGRQELVPVKLEHRQGELWAVPILKGSGAITALSMADGYISVPLELEIVDKGETVEVVLFGGGLVV